MISRTRARHAASADERFDFSGLAALEMLGVGAVAVNAMIAETAAPPDEIIDSALQLRGAILEKPQSGLDVVRAIVLWHAGS